MFSSRTVTSPASMRAVDQSYGISKGSRLGNASEEDDRSVQCGLLVEMTGAKRDRIFLFDAYLKLYRRP